MTKHKDGMGVLKLMKDRPILLGYVAAVVTLILALQILEYVK